MSGKSLTVREQILNLVRSNARTGIYQRDIQKTLGISKSYCSEQLTYLSRVSQKIAKRKEGGLTKIYEIEYFPGILKGVLRIGMLKSSEYIPSIATFHTIFGSERYRIFVRFYNSTRQLIQDFNMGTLEIMLAPTKSIIMSGIMGENLKVISGLASGGSGIISHDEGREAILSTELSSMISLASDSTHNYLPEDIESYDEPTSAVSAYISGECNKIAIWEPYFSDIIKMPGNSILLKYNDIMGDFPCCCAAVNINFYEIAGNEIRQWNSDYRRLTTVYDIDIRELNNAIILISDATGIEKSVVEKSLENYSFNSNTISMMLLKKMGVGLSERQKKNIFLPDVLVD